MVEELEEVQREVKYFISFYISTTSAGKGGRGKAGSSGGNGAKGL